MNYFHLQFPQFDQFDSEVEVAIYSVLPWSELKSVCKT